MSIMLLLYFSALFLQAAGLVPDWAYEFKLKNEVTVGDIATLVVALATVLTVGLGWVQFREAAKQARFTALFNITQKWDNPEMMQLRGHYAAFLDTVRQHVDASALSYSQAATAELERMRGAPTEWPGYQRLLEYCGYFETVGVVTRFGYVELSDTFNLMGGTIIGAGEVFEQHLRKLQETQSKHVFEHFLWPLGDMRRRDSEGTDDE